MADRNDELLLTCPNCGSEDRQGEDSDDGWDCVNEYCDECGYDHEALAIKEVVK